VYIRKVFGAYELDFHTKRWGGRENHLRELTSIANTMMLETRIWTVKRIISSNHGRTAEKPHHGGIKNGRRSLNRKRRERGEEPPQDWEFHTPADLVNLEREGPSPEIQGNGHREGKENNRGVRCIKAKKITVWDYHIQLL